MISCRLSKPHRFKSIKTFWALRIKSSESAQGTTIRSGFDGRGGHHTDHVKMNQSLLIYDRMLDFFDLEVLLINTGCRVVVPIL